MRAACLAVAFTLVACAGDTSTIHIERQASTLATATEDGWVAGGAVLVGAPGTFTFPQPVSLRITLVDPDADPMAEEPPEPMLVSMSKLTIFGEAVAEITENVTCQPTYCEAELTVADFGQTMLQVTATNPDADEGDCFYYAIYESDDPASAGESYRTTAEADQNECLQDLFD
jgi:hypothetical protein